MILVVDHYDSFTYNLVQLVEGLGHQTEVVKSDAETAAALVGRRPDAVILSPGPGRPETSGIICEAVPAFADAGTPVLGVCLGHQAIGHVYGAAVVRAPELMHGKTSSIDHEGRGVFAGLPSPLTATRLASRLANPLE